MAKTSGKKWYLRWIGLNIQIRICSIQVHYGTLYMLAVWYLLKICQNTIKSKLT